MRCFSSIEIYTNCWVKKNLENRLWSWYFWWQKNSNISIIPADTSLGFQFNYTLIVAQFNVSLAESRDTKNCKCLKKKIRKKVESKKKTEPRDSEMVSPNWKNWEAPLKVLYLLLSYEKIGMKRIGKVWEKNFYLSEHHERCSKEPVRSMRGWTPVSLGFFFGIDSARGLREGGFQLWRPDSCGETAQQTAKGCAETHQIIQCAVSLRVK